MFDARKLDRRNQCRAVLALALGLGAGWGSARAGALEYPAAARASLAASYTADLTRAVAGERRVAFRAAGDFGGMTCAPGTIGGAGPASRKLTLTLPDDAAARRRVLAVVTPERGLLEIYSPYEGAADAEDIVVPSRTISWQKARSQRRFTAGAEELDGLRPGSSTPEALFLEEGRYRFALVNGIDAALLKANGTKVRVEAACSFDWTP